MAGFGRRAHYASLQLMQHSYSLQLEADQLAWGYRFPPPWLQAKRLDQESACIQVQDLKHAH